jgi:hypothetical protein
MGVLKLETCSTKTSDYDGLIYVNNDPVNFVDPSGYASYAVNLR